jgi:hypothetical protein
VSERERIERIQREVDSHEGCTRDDCSYNAVEDVRWLLKTLAAANAATERVERERDRLARLMEGRCGTHEDRLAELEGIEAVNGKLEAVLEQTVKERDAAEAARRWSREQYENLRTLELERIAALEHALAQARAALGVTVAYLEPLHRRLYEHSGFMNATMLGDRDYGRTVIQQARALLAPPAQEPGQ